MKMRVRAMYFSGTGTTAKVTSAVAYRIWRQLCCVKAANIDFTPRGARDVMYSFDADDIVVFGTPVIAGRVPNVLLKFLDTIEGGGAIAVPVVLYGNRNFDDALIELRNILEKRGFHTVAAAAFVGEHSFSSTLAAGRPDIEDMKIAENFAVETAAKLASMIEDCKGDKDVLRRLLDALGPVQVEGHEPLRDYYKPQDRNGNHINILKVKPKLDESKCNSCGVCVQACPMGSIDAARPGIVDGICIKCCGCVKKCPQGALYYDDEGYLYHKEELELGYAQRKEPSLFL